MAKPNLQDFARYIREREAYANPPLLKGRQGPPRHFHVHPIFHYLIMARRRQKISQDELAIRIGVAINLVNRWERGAMPQTANLIAWANALGFDVTLRKKPKVRDDHK